MSAGRKNNDTNKNYNTPPKYIKLINEFFENNIDLDPCSNKYSMINAKQNIILPDNGLNIEWCDIGNPINCFVNPPYGKGENKTSIKTWIKKGIDSYIKYNTESLFLIPVATNTQHYKMIYENAKGISFLYDTRLKFWNEGVELSKGCPVSCAMIYFGNNYEKFEKIFNNVGKCIILNE